MCAKARKPKRKTKSSSSKVRKSNSSTSKKVASPKVSQSSSPGWLPYSLIAIGFFLFLYLRFNYIDIPLDRDEGTYLHMGNMLFKGQVPFVDFYEIKPPGMFVTYGIFHLLFGSSLVTLHIGLLILILISMYLIFLIANDFFKNSFFASISAVIFGFFSLNVYMLGFGIMSEYFLVLFGLWSFWLMIKSLDDQSDKLLLLSGVILGWAFMIRQHAIFFAVPIGIYFLIHYRKDLKLLFNKALYFGAGILIPVVLVVVWMLAVGGFDDMIFWVFERTAKGYTQAISWERGMGFLNTYFNVITSTQLALFVTAALGVPCLWLSKITLNKKIFITLLTITTFGATWPGLRFYGHYWINMIPALSLLFAIPFLLAKDYMKLPGQYNYLALSTVFMAVLIFNIYHRKDLNLEMTGEQVVRKMYGENPNIAVHELTKFLERTMEPTDDIFVFGSEPQVYYQLDRVPKTRHVFVAMIHKPGEENLGYQDEVINYLETDPPEYIMHIQNKYSIGMSEGAEPRLFEWIYYYEESDYIPVAMADIINRNNIIYKYGAEARNQKPQSKNYIIVYKKR